MVDLALPPEPRLEQRNLPKRRGAEWQVLGRTGFDVRGWRSLFSSSPSVEPTHTGGRREQEFGQAQEAAQAEGTEDAQAAPKREARDQEGRLRPHLPGSQVET